MSRDENWVPREHDKRTRAGYTDAQWASWERMIEEPAPPATEVQALMEAAPYEEPRESLEEREARLEPLRDALEGGVLTEREKWIVESYFWRGMSMAAIGEELSLAKSTVHRIHHEALAKLAEHLS